ncbi:hypothetical protein QYE76_070582 [Lolium multiflorum]|uniref:Uncharacterized protein n=1 Tax=Lolium multiflorum TaxID=4521 RepID=A0AAD8SIF9_LOLMU|nr:hypothetical protein QYE76_070582 [Lolium multiflorum]
MDLASSRKQEAGTSSRASGKDKTRGAWRGSDVTQFEIDWLYRSRRIPEGVICRLPGNEIQPVLKPGKDIPAPKPPVQCGSCIIGSRQGSPFFKFNGLESCRLWQTTFFYVKNAGDDDLINLPAFNPAPPAKTNWQYNPGTEHAETNRVVRFMMKLMKDTNICSDDIIRAFISRRVLPLQQRAHKISEMYGPGDPTKITGLALSKEDVVLKASQICQTDMPEDWEWGLCPLSARNPPSKEAKARFPRIDSDRRGPCRKRPWTNTPSASNNPQVHEHEPPLQAEVGDEFLDKLMAEGQKSDPPAAGAGPSHASSGKRPRTEVIGGKQVGTKRYKQKRMPMSSGPALELGSAGSARTSTPPPHSSPAPSGAGNSSASLSGGTTSSGRAAPTPPDHRAEEDFTSPPETQDTGASNIGAGQTDAGQAEPLVPPPPKKKKKQPSSSPTAPDTSAPVPSPPTKATPTPPPSQGPSAAKQPAPSGTPKITNFLKPGASRGKAVEGAASSGSGDVVLHVGPAAIAAQDKPTGLLGRIVDLKRAGKDLGHLLPYAQKWNEADISASTRGLGKDRLPAPDPAGARCTEEHFSRLKRAVKEFDSAWYDATNNVVSTADARKQLFEELLWEHRDLAEAHSHCQVVPEATIEALKAQVAKLQGEKEQLLKEHNEALEAQKTALGELKEQAIQAALRHDQALKDARVAAEARLAEVVEDSTNSNTVLTAELEEERKSRKAAERLIDTMTTDHREYDRLVMKIDALALQHFPESQVYALKKHMRSVDRLLADLPAAAIQVFKVLWPEEELPGNITLTAARLNDAGHRIREWQCSAARAGADTALRSACSWYPDLNLDALQGVRADAPTDTDPALAAKRRDRAYRLAEYAEVRTFIPPPPGVKDYLSDEEEEDEGDEGEAAEDVPPEAPEAGAAPPEDVEAGDAAPDAPAI